MKNYTATVGGVTKSLLEWGFTEAQMQTCNQEADYVSLTSPLSQLALDDAFPVDAMVDIHRGDTRIFQGRCVPITSAVGARRNSVMRLDGAWAELESRQYLQPWQDGVSSSSSLWGRLALSADPSAYNPDSPTAWLITNGAAVSNVLQFAIDKGAPMMLGTIAPGIQAPSESATDLMASDVIKMLLGWTPGAVVWFDYSTNPVTIHVDQPETIAAVTLPITSFEQLQKVQLSWKQTVDAVYLSTRVQETNEEAMCIGSFGTLLQYPPAAEGLPLPGERGAVLVSLDDIDVQDTSSIAMAKSFYGACQAMKWDVQGQLRGEDVPTAVRVGKALNISGSRTVWASMNTLVQRTTDNFRTGTRRIECGAPRNLQGRNLPTLLNPNRRRTPVDANAAQQQATGQSWRASYGPKGGNAGQGDSGAGTISGATAHTYYMMKDVGGVPAPIFATINSKEIG